MVGDRGRARGGDQLGGAASGGAFVGDDLEVERHRAHASCCSLWPPNCSRIAERTLSPKSPRSRE